MDSGIPERAEGQNSKIVEEPIAAAEKNSERMKITLRAGEENQLHGVIQLMV